MKIPYNLFSTVVHVERAKSSCTAAVSSFSGFASCLIIWSYVAALRVPQYQQLAALEYIEDAIGCDHDVRFTFHTTVAETGVKYAAWRS